MRNQSQTNTNADDMTKDEDNDNAEEEPGEEEEDQEDAQDQAEEEDVCDSVTAWKMAKLLRLFVGFAGVASAKLARACIGCVCGKSAAKGLEDIFIPWHRQKFYFLVSCQGKIAFNSSSFILQGLESSKKLEIMFK